jgi:hypothetical protein
MSAYQGPSINNLTMYLAGGACKDFYPWDLVLEEGFSRLYRGELTVLSTAKHTMEELSGLLDRRISLTLTQKVGGKAASTLRTRYLHGIVTGVRSAGIFSQGSADNETDGFSYVLTIEPELARLRFTRFTTPYYRMNPPDIFTAILEKYGMSASMEAQYISTSENTYSSHLLFDQSGLSDLDFIKNIAALYGISFTFVHPRVASATTLGSSVLYFSDGRKFPRSAVLYSKSGVEWEDPNTVNFSFLSVDESESIWKMPVWNMTKTIGVDGISLNALYPNTNYGSEQWKVGSVARGNRFVNHNRLFHGYERQTPPGEIDKDIAMILEVRQGIADQAKSRWAAEAPNLALRPALVLKLSDFYGTKNAEDFTALVTGIRLHHRATWPSKVPVRPEGSDTAEVTEVTANCIDWGANVKKRYYPEEQPI